MATKGTAVAKAKVNLPVDIQARMKAEVADIKRRLSLPSGNKIKVAMGKKFKVDGAEVSEFEGVIIDFIAFNAFYENEDFDRDEIVPPICFSLNPEPLIMVPSENSPAKQAETCASCPMAKFRSAKNGKAKRCKHNRILALIPVDADVDTKISLLKVSPTAITEFDAYVASVAARRDLPVRGVITKFSFNPAVEYSSVRFSDMGAAPNDLLLQADSRLEDARALLAVEPEIKQEEVAAPVAKKPTRK